ncbi:hypothetical protein Desti_2552 [Desulfomonile tiedjei DSM 6799]|uniref:Uncharacterized protein n=1 Tax=Desulfomonile tiedjei (strain ATCC 49306 / DSM 6799 / DCB-1) TaxID=706587 RepID=I4C6P1_DESTA|nr:hypothetical protein Desti_2552 [Desulfomonile tiedjei DSM 6799]
MEFIIFTSNRRFLMVAALLAMTAFNGMTEWTIPIFFANTRARAPMPSSHDDAMNI